MDGTTLRATAATPPVSLRLPSWDFGAQLLHRRDIRYHMTDLRRMNCTVLRAFGASVLGQCEVGFWSLLYQACSENDR